MKWILMICMLFVLAPAAMAADIMGTHCDSAHIIKPESQIKCELETKYNGWSEILISSNEFVMEGVEKSTRGYVERE